MPRPGFKRKKPKRKPLRKFDGFDLRETLQKPTIESETHSDDEKKAESGTYILVRTMNRAFNQKNVLRQGKEILPQEKIKRRRMNYSNGEEIANHQWNWNVQLEEMISEKSPEIPLDVQNLIIAHENQQQAVINELRISLEHLDRKIGVYQTEKNMDENLKNYMEVKLEEKNIEIQNLQTKLEREKSKSGDVNNDKIDFSLFNCVVQKADHEKEVLKNQLREVKKFAYAKINKEMAAMKIEKRKVNEINSEKLSSIGIQLKEKTVANGKLNNEISMLKTKLEDKTRECELNNGQVLELTIENEKKIAYCQTKFEEKNQKLSLKCAKYESQISELQDRFKSWDENYHKRILQLQGAKSQEKELKEKIDKLEKSLDTASKEKENYVKELDKLKFKIKEVEVKDVSECLFQFEDTTSEIVKEEIKEEKEVNEVIELRSKLPEVTDAIIKKEPNQ